MKSTRIAARVYRAIKSCETVEQLITATTYLDLAMKFVAASDREKLERALRDKLAKIRRKGFHVVGRAGVPYAAAGNGGQA